MSHIEFIFDLESLWDRSITEEDWRNFEANVEEAFDQFWYWGDCC